MSFSDGNKAGTIAEGDAVQLTCRSQEWQQQDRDNLPNLTWHWTRRDEQNVSVTLELGSGPGPDGVGRIAESTRRNGYGLSHLSWTNISSQAAGTYKCTHQQSGVSASYILAVSSTSRNKQTNINNGSNSGRRETVNYPSKILNDFLSLFCYSRQRWTTTEEW